MRREGGEQSEGDEKNFPHSITLVKIGGGEQRRQQWGKRDSKETVQTACGLFKGRARENLNARDGGVKKRRFIKR